MKATDWEFRNRALIFGLCFGLGFPFYSIDKVNVTAALADWLSPHLQANPDTLARGIFVIAAIVMAIAAATRTWASSYLHAGVVYASAVKTESLVADGPYRHVRNPLYFANILMAFAMGALMSRSGFVFAVVAMIVFCHRLIFREEAELAATQGASYEKFRRAVPRLLPSLRARIPSSGRRPEWSAGFKAEAWYWGFVVSLAVFAATLKMTLFMIILAASIGLFWAYSASQRKNGTKE